MAAATGQEALAASRATALLGTIVDNAGVVRCKVVPRRRLESITTTGVGLSPVFAVMAADDHLTAAPGLDTPSGDMRLVPDLGAAAPLDEQGRLWWAPCDQLDQEHRPMPICQRTVLATLEREAAAAGWSYRMSFEVEFTLLRDGEPVHRGPGYGAHALLEQEGFALDLLRALEAAGLAVEQFHPEYSLGQFEVSVAPAAPTAAADRLVLLRLLVARTAQRHGLRVSFAPVVLPGEVGNGCHLHFSLWDAHGNTMAGGAGPLGMQPAGCQALAGLLQHLPELTAVLTPSVLSYQRLQPSHWSGAYACWGHENREAALRLVAATGASGPASANCELKPVDSASNPYLVAACVLAATQHGLRRNARLPEPVRVDPHQLSDQERADRGVRRLPDDLGKAVAAAEASSLLREALGAPLLDAFLAVRRDELERFGGLDVAEAVAALWWRYA
jgi:glutamine synthetase